MAERRAVNKYYPPEWDPSKGSVNAARNSHPLRARARKLDQGILVVRFEMPYNIWCLTCENHIAMGVRFNAEKSRVGSYYTSPIYKFRMKCHLCDNHFEIQTDPSKFDYVIISGARKQVRISNEELEDTREFEIAREEETKRKLKDAMFRLEKKVEAKTRVAEQEPNLVEIKKWRAKFEDSYAVNQLVRRQYRERRKKLEELKSQDKKLLKKASLKLTLLKRRPEDREEAKRLLSLSSSAKTDTKHSETKAFGNFNPKGLVGSSLCVSRKPSIRVKSKQT